MSENTTTPATTPSADQGPAPKRKGRRKVWGLTAAALTVLVIGGAAAGGTGSGTAADPAPAAPTATADPAPAPTQAPAAPAPTQAPAPAPRPVTPAPAPTVAAPSPEMVAVANEAVDLTYVGFLILDTTGEYPAQLQADMSANTAKLQGITPTAADAVVSAAVVRFMDDGQALLADGDVSDADLGELGRLGRVYGNVTGWEFDQLTIGTRTAQYLAGRNAS